MSFTSSNVHGHDLSSESGFINTRIQQSWLNETVSTEILIQGKPKITGLKLICSDLKSIKSRISHKFILVRVLKQVISENSIGKCGNDNKTYDPVLVADMLEEADTLNTETNSGTFYLSIKIPATINPGRYLTMIQLQVKNKILPQKLSWFIDVLPRKLPDKGSSDFYLNLWQNPYAVSGYYNIIPWSPAHFKLLSPVMKLLADAGQKCITTSFFWNTFNVQSEGLKNAMIITRRLASGQWDYDYTHFDAWVQFMINLGIRDKIIVFGLDPWYPNYWYWDETKEHEIKMNDPPGTSAYKQFWTPMLTAFSSHMKAKGWFSRIAIGIDERPAETIKEDLAFIRSIDPGFQIQLSGLFNQEIEENVDDYAVNSNQVIPKNILLKRNQLHKTSSYYTACWEASPNTLLYNEPGDAWFLPVHALAVGLNGYSRYAFNNWSKNNLTDARNSELPPGDGYFVYPGPRSSIRFEKLKEGIVFTMKWKILMSEAKTQQNIKMKESLDRLLARFKVFKSQDDQVISTSVSEINKW